MMHSSKTILTAAAITSLVTSASYAETLSFEDLQHGDVANGNYRGVEIEANNRGGGPDLAVVFNSTLRGTEDPDLEGPRTHQAGDMHTVTQGSWSGGNLAPDTELGNMLILQESGEEVEGRIDERPDDEASRPAGDLSFSFDQGITSFGFDLVDMEGASEYGNNGGFLATFKQGETFLGSVSFGDFTSPGSEVYDPTVEYGNNTANRFDPLSAGMFGADSFDKVQIALGGSAGVDNIKFQPVPTPSAALAGVAMFGMLIARRRRQA